jgi:hypothetical protein
MDSFRSRYFPFFVLSIAKTLQLHAVIIVVRTTTEAAVIVVIKTNHDDNDNEGQTMQILLYYYCKHEKTHSKNSCVSICECRMRKADIRIKAKGEKVTK